MNPKPQSDEWFELLEQTSPIDMLASWSESEPTISQKTMVEELIEREKCLLASLIFCCNLSC